MTSAPTNKSNNKTSSTTMTTAERRRRTKRIMLQKAVANVHSSYNNTIVSITNEKGDVITWSSGGGLGYKGSKKSTPYVAQLVADACAKTIKEYGVKELDVRVRGVGPGREAAVNGLKNSGLTILTVKDVTSPPFNGCRRPRRPRK